LLGATPYYHCAFRYVRRAFLCGEDTQTGTSYEHRRQWIRDPNTLLIQSGRLHYHVALHINLAKASEWDDEGGPRLSDYAFDFSLNFLCKVRSSMGLSDYILLYFCR
jgi:hypothetical protein